MDSQTILGYLKLRHPAPEWATFAEMRNGTGYGVQERYIDLFAIDLYPSKVFHSVAYEVKISRADFLRELKQPEKRTFAETIANECVFAMPTGTAKLDEIPEGWGLLEIGTAGPRIAKAAQQRKVEAWPMRFSAALARRCSDPGTKIPKALWKFQGIELTEEELRAATSDTWKKTYDERLRQAESRGKMLFENDPAYRNLQALRRAVSNAMGRGPFGEVTVECFENWLSTRETGSVDPKKAEALKRAVAQTSAALDALFEGVAKK